MRRFQHLPGVERVEIGIVVTQPRGHFAHHSGDRPGGGSGEFRQSGELPFERSNRLFERAGRVFFEHYSSCITSIGLSRAATRAGYNPASTVTHHTSKIALASRSTGG